MANLFNSIRISPPKYNRFNLSHDVKLTGKFGKLIPILCRPTLPGDVYKLTSEVLVRLAPMIAPIMTKVNVYTHFFFVPNRLVYKGWKDFITGGEDGESNEIYPRLKISSSMASNFKPGSLADYLGFPVQDNLNAPVELDILPFKAYQLIYNEYYRDQNIDPEVDIMEDESGIHDMTGSPDRHSELLKLRDRCWKKDYFTSALPFAQRGEEVELPLQGDAPLMRNGNPNDTKAYLSPTNSVMPLNGGPLGGDGTIKYQTNSGGSYGVLTNSANQALKLSGGSTGPNPYVDLSGISADLSKASSATINELRRAIKAQEFLELAARGGSRYIEQIYAYFGVRSSDARLQRPEFLGGGKSPIMISDVLQTSQSTDNSAQANPAGHGVSVQRTHGFKYRCEEHGYIIGIMSIMPEAAYMQGMPRLFSKFDRLDYYWPQFAHLGEQEIKNKELYFQTAPPSQSVNEQTFGYTPRYAEYKTMMDSIHGDFRSSLSFWHMGRIFSSLPGLNSAFLHNVEDAANRVFNVVDENVDKIWVNIHHEFKALMKMPKYGTPYL